MLTAQISYASCFIASEQDKIIAKEGECKKRYAPACSFNIALGLMGFDSGILVDKNNPTWISNGSNIYPNACNGEHKPQTWMRDSCVWYSKKFTSKLGMNKFQEYVQKFRYGNMDLSGGLTKAWIASSLQISPIEQIEFLQKIVQKRLPVSSLSYIRLKEIMFIQELVGGWKLYGKTGLSVQKNKEGNLTDLENGWFIGYIEKNGQSIQFASHIVDSEKQDAFASFRARNEALNKLWYIINDLEK